jgi:hypothetical protein
MWQMKDGFYQCSKDRFASEQSARKWCEVNKEQYPETYLFIEVVPTLWELIYSHTGD